MLSDTILPTDNEWGVPCLDPEMQATEIRLPVLAWGSRRRGAINTGTWSLYVDDYRFGAARTDPSVVTRTECYAATEINLSVRDQTPRAVALANTYEKRRIARLWQAAGVRVFVDLCVAPHCRDLNMLGVPPGWAAFATRGYASAPESLVEEYEAARQWAGRAPLLLVTGGGETIRRVCQRLPGAVWVDAGAEMRSRLHKLHPSAQKDNSNGQG
jgi:hypothetical protein